MIFTSFFPLIFCNNKERAENSIYILNLKESNGGCFIQLDTWTPFIFPFQSNPMHVSVNVKTVVQQSMKLMTRLLFCSPKFSRKLFYITRLQDLADIVHLDQIDIPKQVMEQVSLLCLYMLQVKIKFRLKFLMQVDSHFLCFLALIHEQLGLGNKGNCESDWIKYKPQDFTVTIVFDTTSLLCS